MTKTRTAFHSLEVSQGLSMNKDTKKSETMCETQFAGTEQLKGSWHPFSDSKLYGSIFKLRGLAAL